MKTPIIDTGRFIRLITIIPEKRLPGWCDLHGICGLDSENQAFCHPYLDDLRDDQLQKINTFYLVKFGKYLCPLIAFEQLKEHLGQFVTEIEIVEQRVRQAINRGDGEIQPLFVTTRRKTRRQRQI